MPVKSRFPDIDIPNVDIYSFLFERKDKPYPDDHVLHIDGATGREQTYAQVKEQSRVFGVALKTLWGWKKGDVMAIFAPNSIDTPVAIWGVLWASGVLSPANPAYSVDEFVHQLKDCGAKAITTTADFLPTATAAAAKAGIPKDRILILGDKKAPGFKHFRDLRNMSHREEKLTRRSKIDPAKDLAFLVYSSGTTGLPKGVMLSHTNLISNVCQTGSLEGPNISWETDKTVAFLPFFHIYGLSVVMHLCFHTGLPLIVMDRFDMEKFCQLVQKYKATFSHVVPPVVLLLVKSPVVSKYDLSSLRMLNSGAAPLTRELQVAVYERTRIPVKQGYGLSETSPCTHTQLWADYDKKIGSVGPLVPNMLAKYVDEEGNEVKAGQTGELWMKGPNIMMGYLNNPTATANAITPDGYFKTGDVGHQDEEGNFYITDRVKELIKYKGFQVAPAELEGFLLSHPKVDDVAVTGIYSEELASEVPRAYVVLAAGNKPSEDTAREISDFVAKAMAQHKKLRGGVRFVDQIPKSASGKILRRVLKDMAKKEQQRKEGAKL